MAQVLLGLMGHLLEFPVVAVLGLRLPLRELKPFMLAVAVAARLMLQAERLLG